MKLSLRSLLRLGVVVAVVSASGCLNGDITWTALDGSGNSSPSSSSGGGASFSLKVDGNTQGGAVNVQGASFVVPDGSVGGNYRKSRATGSQFIVRGRITGAAN